MYPLVYVLGVADSALDLAGTSVREARCPRCNISEGPYGAWPQPWQPELDRAVWAPYLPYVTPSPATLQPQNSVATTENFWLQNLKYLLSGSL